MITDILSKIANQIKAFEDAKNSIAKILRNITKTDLNNLSNLGHDFRESLIINPISKIDPSGLSFCAVDGGIVQRQIASYNIILLRAIAVIFKYIQGQPPYVNFFPDPFPKVDVIYSRIANQNESDQFGALLRIKKELSTAIAAIHSENINILIMDGALHFHPTDIPNKGSSNFKLFMEVIELYKELYRISKENHIYLIGLIKDSHSNAFIKNMLILLPVLLKSNSELKEILSYDYRNILERCYDVDILNYMLNTGERSAVLKIAKNNTLINSDIYYFYLKSSEFDLPVRVEFLLQNDIFTDVSRISGALLPIMGHHIEFSLPAPLIEADMRAKIDSQQIEEIINHIALLSGVPYSLFRKRRERSPFGGKTLA